MTTICHEEYILYKIPIACYLCDVDVLDPDFSRWQAHKLNNHVICQKCHTLYDHNTIVRVINKAKKDNDVEVLTRLRKYHPLYMKMVQKVFDTGVQTLPDVPRKSSS